MTASNRHPKENYTSQSTKKNAKYNIALRIFKIIEQASLLITGKEHVSYRILLFTLLKNSDIQASIVGFRTFQTSPSNLGELNSLPTAIHIFAVLDIILEWHIVLEWIVEMYDVTSFDKIYHLRSEFKARIT